jgi:hypothetical protein
VRAHALPAAEVSAAQLDWVLAHDLLGGDGKVVLHKGTVLDEAALAGWPHAAPGEVHLLQLDADDVHEDVAGRRIAEMIAGQGLRVSGPVTSRYDLIAERKGLLRVDADLLRAVNHVEDITVYSLFDRQPVLPNTPVASIKVTPIATTVGRIGEVERLVRAADGPLLEVRPFQLRRIGVVAVEALDGEQRRRFEGALER